SSKSAWPARPRSDAAWSMIPDGTPTARCSARRSAFASSSGSSSKPATAQSARPTTTSSAPDDDLRATELAELRRDRIHVPLPALHVLGGRELGAVGRLALEPYAAVDRGREDEAADEVGVLADQVDAAGREERPHAAYPC